MTWPERLLTVVGLAAIGVLLVAVIYLLSAIEAARVDPATPADSTTGQECRSYPASLLDADPQLAAQQVAARSACWSPPPGVTR